MAEVEPWSCQPQGYLLPQPGRDGGEGTGLTRTLGDFAAERRAQLSPQVSRSRSLPLGTVLISLPAGLRGAGGGGKKPAFGDLLGSWTWLQAHRRWFVSSLPGPAGSTAPIPKQQSVAVRVQGIAAFHAANKWVGTQLVFLLSLACLPGCRGIRQLGETQLVLPMVSTSHPRRARPAVTFLWSFNRSQNWDQNYSQLHLHCALSLWIPHGAEQLP